VAKPVLQIIIASTRPGRVGPVVADWIIDRAQARGDFEVVVTDLAELNLPMFDEPNHPRLHQYVHQHTKDWSAIVDRSETGRRRDARRASPLGAGPAPAALQPYDTVTWTLG
jgi:NADPH-dependent FMN reductase